MKTRISPESIATYLRSHYAQVGTLEAIAEGEESQAFAIEADGQALVVRVNRGREGFEKDRLAADRFTAVPVPAIFAIDALEGAWICVSERARGETLQALGAAAARYGGAILGALDAIAGSDVSFVTGAGPFDVAGRGASASWTGFVTAIDGPDDLVRRINGRRYPDLRKLVHADFGSNNVLVADGEVTAVIDWSEAMAGDPLYDFANLFFWRSWLDCMEVQCRHIETHHPERLADRDLLDCYQLRIGLQVLDEARRDGDEKLVAWSLARCREIA
jgi:hygromycin-B 4-O-kinase